MPISAKLFKIETWLFYLYICFRPQGMRWNSQNFHQINILHSRGVFNFTPKYWGKVERFWVPINGHIPTYIKKINFSKNLFMKSVLKSRTWFVALYSSSSYRAKCGQNRLNFPHLTVLCMPIASTPVLQDIVFFNLTKKLLNL